jgi:hypothetical protein
VRITPLSEEAAGSAEQPMPLEAAPKALSESFFF